MLILCWIVRSKMDDRRYHTVTKFMMRLIYVSFFSEAFGSHPCQLSGSYCIKRKCVVRGPPAELCLLSSDLTA